MALVKQGNLFLIIKSSFYMLKYIILDVDGTLTDGGVYYDNTGYR